MSEASGTLVTLMSPKCHPSEAQMAFVKSRQILDGIAIENEVVDDAKKKGDANV